MRTEIDNYIRVMEHLKQEMQQLRKPDAKIQYTNQDARDQSQPTTLARGAFAGTTAERPVRQGRSRPWYLKVKAPVVVLMPVPVPLPVVPTKTPVP